MKKYTLEEISKPGFIMDASFKGLGYYSHGKLYLYSGGGFNSYTSAGITKYSNEECLVVRSMASHNYYIPISELIRIGILEEQPKEIQF